MNKAEAIAYLTRCADDNGIHWYQGRPWDDVESCPTCHGSNDAGWLKTPCSRYGHDSASCAEVAWQVYQRTDNSDLDTIMSAVVNDADWPEEELQDYAIGLAGADIDAMVQGYLECQLWAGLDYREDGKEPVHYDENYGIEDISPEYVDKITSEFRELVSAHPLAVRMYLNKLGRYDQVGYERNGTFGHNYYLTRERHGVGFWDRGLGELGEYLSDIAHYAGGADDLWDNGDGVLR